MPTVDDVNLICTHCQLPFARIQNETLVIESRHHGEKHVNVIPLDMLQRILSGHYNIQAPQPEGLTTHPHTE